MFVSQTKQLLFIFLQLITKQFENCPIPSVIIYQHINNNHQCNKPTNYNAFLSAGNTRPWLGAVNHKMLFKHSRHYQLPTSQVLQMDKELLSEMEWFIQANTQDSYLVLWTIYRPVFDYCSLIYKVMCSLKQNLISNGLSFCQTDSH